MPAKCKGNYGYVEQPNNLPEENMPKKKVWILAFIFSFLALLVDGADLALLAYSLTSLKQEFSLSSIQAGALGSWTLACTLLVAFGGWACDRFGRVRVIVIAIVLFSSLTFWLGFLRKAMMSLSKQDSHLLV